ncbi:Cof-type HAD-IIB family hydrolase [Metabacillus malikii]|uniref:Cof subfamily protein (Haloacid dehalogenase superfamily) n=1 Tax=Metabacillus malikii TaxID=1504265 RepID=A0ABT9ZM52_9BACI|nr:Cof-type HAD-IIB family hydrolase [Metabacillus malikii]MDQ0232280.1 Cof subfamily protein (haloacid dehalogenase superfamily) [Metabacillus malikii]
MSTNPFLIALDLDGTLLKDDKTISSYSKEIIEKAKAAGHIVCIATGRPFRSSSLYYDELQLTSPIINFNGAYVHHPKDDSWGTYHTTLELDVVKDIIDVAEKHQLHNVLAEIIDDVYFHYHDEKLLDIFSMGNPTVKIGDLRENLRDDVTSILIHAAEEEVEKIREYLSDVHANVVDHRRWAAPWHVIEIIKAGMNKAVGLKKVADYYKIPAERIIAFGDEDNDLEMLQFAGHGIAMGNAIDKLKAVANKETLTNEEDGIAYYLKKTLDL